MLDVIKDRSGGDNESFSSHINSFEEEDEVVESDD